MLPCYENSHYGTSDEGCVQLHSIPILVQSASRCELAQFAILSGLVFSFSVQMRSMWIERRFNVHPMPSADASLESLESVRYLRILKSLRVLQLIQLKHSLQIMGQRFHNCEFSHGYQHSMVAFFVEFANKVMAC